MGSFLSKVRAVQSTLGVINSDLADTVETSVQLVRQSLLAGGKVLIFGNGGSAADSQHFAAELVASLHGAPLPTPLRAIALTTDTSVMTAIGNDADFTQVFARQVHALCEARDVVIGLSTSGRSVNVLEGLRRARELGAKTIAITGASGLAEQFASVEVRIPSSETQVVQAITLVVLHSVCEDIDGLREIPT